MEQFGIIVAAGTKTPCCGRIFQSMDGFSANIAIIRKDGKEFTIKSSKGFTCHCCGKVYTNFPVAYLYPWDWDIEALLRDDVIPLDRRYLYRICREA